MLSQLQVGDELAGEAVATQQQQQQQQPAPAPAPATVVRFGRRKVLEAAKEAMALSAKHHELCHGHDCALSQQARGARDEVSALIELEQWAA